MGDEVIDLTDSPPPEYIVIDVEEAKTTSEKTDTITHSEVGRDGGRKKARRKKRKRSMVEGDILSSVAQTRETSLEEGEVEINAQQEGKPLLSTTNRKAGVDVDMEQPQKSKSRRGIDSPQTQNSRRSSRSPRRKKTPPRDPNPNDLNLFFIDIKPAALPTSSLFVTPTIPGNEAGPSLLLPAHVSVFGAAPVEILPSTNADSDEEDYIDYLDFDDRKVRITLSPQCSIADKYHTGCCTIL